MKKLSPAQERVLREVAAGLVKLVRGADSAHSVTVWSAIGNDGKRVNRQFDPLVKAGLIKSVDGAGASRKVVLTITGEDVVAALPLPGTLVYQEFHRGTGVAWMIRKEEGVRLAFVLYKDGQVYDRYARPDSVYAVFRSFCPYVFSFEGDMGL